MKRRTAVRGLAALLAAGAVGCAREEKTGARQRATTPPEPGHLRRHMDDAARTLDPSLNTDVYTQLVIDDLFEGLTRLDAAGTVIPAVARRWTVDAAGTTWTFELRKDARWTNGDPVTAHDFVYSWQRLVTPATRSQSVQQVAPLVNAVDIAEGRASPETLGVRALGDFGLEVRLNQRTPWFLYLLTNNFLIRSTGPRWKAATNPGPDRAAWSATAPTLSSRR